MEFHAYTLPRPIEIGAVHGAANAELFKKQRHKIGPYNVSKKFG